MITIISSLYPNFSMLPSDPNALLKQLPLDSRPISVTSNTSEMPQRRLPGVASKGPAAPSCSGAEWFPAKDGNVGKGLRLGILIHLDS